MHCERCRVKQAKGAITLEVEGCKWMRNICPDCIRKLKTWFLMPDVGGDVVDWVMSVGKGMSDGEKQQALSP